jgi:putative addiction module component (TIGR02574 family)
VSITGERVREEALNLSEAERAELAHLLIRSLDGPPDPDAEAAWDEKLERRLAEIKAGTVTGKPVRQMIADVRASLS